MLTVKWNFLAFIVLGVFILPFKGLSMENIQPKYTEISLGFMLPEPFNYTQVMAANDNDVLKSLIIKYGDKDIFIDRKDLGQFYNVDLRSLRIYEGVSIDIENNQEIKERKNIESFSLCFQYGAFKKGFRLNRSGWYRDLFQVVIQSSGSYEILKFPMESQNLPKGPCW